MKKVLCVVLSLLCMISSFGICAFAEDTACEHAYDAIVVAPTCAESGYTLHTCSKCGDYYKDNFKDARGHSWDQQTLYEVYPASCTEEGLAKHVCIVCNAAETQTLPVLPHTDVDKDGKCDSCGKEMEVKTEFAPFDWLVAFFKAVIQWFKEIFA